MSLLSALALSASLAASDVPRAAPVLAMPAPQADAAGTADVLQRLYPAAAQAVVQVGDDVRTAGVVLTESGVIATPSGVARGKTELGIGFSNGFHTRARVVAVDEALGLALLKLDGLPSMAYAKLASEGIAPSQAAYAYFLGSPLRPLLTFARVASPQVMRSGVLDDRVFTAPFKLNPRMVGGPVLGWSGEVIGLVLATDGTGTGFVLSAPAILAFLQSHADVLPRVAFTVKADPSVGEVWIDGEHAGPLPLSLPGLGVGQHLVVLRAPGLPDTVRPVLALGLSQQTLSVVQFAGAAVEIDAPADAQVRVDGVLRGVGPTTLWLPGGRHRLHITAVGKRVFSRPIEVVEDRPLRVDVQMEDAAATLKLDSKPSAVQVQLDGQRVGATPVALKVSPGRHEVGLAQAGLHSVSVGVYARDGATVDLGVVTMDKPYFTLQVKAQGDVQLSIDGGPRHTPAGKGERLAPGEHEVVYFQPYQYRTKQRVRGDDGQVVTAEPVFVAAGQPSDIGLYSTLATASEGVGGLGLLVSGGFFLAAEAHRDSVKGLSDTGRSQLQAGLGIGTTSLALFALGAFLSYLEPTPEMGYAEDALK